jgi:cell wall-associated NlpC family hydrolase
LKAVFLSVCLLLLSACAISSSFAGQSITVTLDVPQLQGSDTVTPPPMPKVERNESAVKTSASSANGGVAIGRVGVVTAPKAAIYRSRTSSRILATCAQDTPLGVVGEKGAWYGVLMIDMSTGWIRKSAVRLLDYDIVAKNTRSTGSAGSSTQGQQIVQSALKYTGVPYVWGGSSCNGLDCSGFVKTVYSEIGVNLPRVSRDQANVGAPVTWDDLQAGDRLYFACKGPEVDHCGIYMGNGLFIHSSVRRGGVAVDNLTSGFFARTLVAARRS